METVDIYNMVEECETRDSCLNNEGFSMLKFQRSPCLPHIAVAMLSILGSFGLASRN